MILQRRLVDLTDEGILVGAVGADRVQVLGTFAEGAVYNVFLRVFTRIGIVPRTPVAGAENRDPERRKQRRRKS